MNEWRVKLVHVFREGNCAADWLANLGVAHNSNVVVFNNVPSELGRIIMEDARGVGVAIPHLVPP